MRLNRSFLKSLRTLGMIEGTSTLLLFGLAMPLKYFAGMPLAVTIVGSIHGFLFVGLVAMLLVAIWKVPISVRLALAGVAAAILTGGPFLLERRLAQIGATREAASSRAAVGDRACGAGVEFADASEQPAASRNGR